ncbi:MAG: ATP-binding cassette domain-containing protein, partial [Pseudonocardiaceae bacterium]
SVRNTVSGLLRLARQILFTFVAALVGLCVLAPAAALVSGVLVALALTFFAFLLPGLAARRKAVLLAEEEVARQAGIAFGGIRDAIVCGAQDRAIGVVGTAIDGAAASARVLARSTALRSLIVFVGGQLPLVTLLVAAPSLLQARYLTFGELVGVATYLTVSLEPAIAEGEHLAVIGPSGIGKSTLASLLGGLLVPGRGSVRLGGVDVAQIRAADLRRLVGVIPQEAYVFAGTLRENLSYLAPQATDRALTDAAAALGLAPLIDRLGGLDARLGAGGAELSNGEKQLVALARVYLSPARILILDEATCNLDPKAEARAEAIFARRPGTLVVIAHRISSARRARRVLLLDGDRVNLGPHD